MTAKWKMPSNIFKKMPACPKQVHWTNQHQRLWKHGTSFPLSGPDVDELIKLLWEKGFAPDPLKLEKRDGHYVFTQDIEMIVKRYQVANGLTETGVVDETFVKSIKGAS